MKNVKYRIAAEGFGKICGGCVNRNAVKYCYVKTGEVLNKLTGGWKT